LPLAHLAHHLQTALQQLTNKSSIPANPTIIRIRDVNRFTFMKTLFKSAKRFPMKTFEMCIWQRMEISWMDKILNKD